MTERSYQDAVQTLKNRLGGRWDGLEAEGRDEMVRVLKEQLGYDSRQANDAIDVMVASGALRYHAARGAASEAVAGPPIPAPASSTTSGTPIVGVPAAGAFAAGYWQIGEGVVESAARKGQVTPT
ncbi:MAG TPA: hypothetical protein VGJ87_19470 [Roseiflexaceae bacterium]|jgi:hypothetical protein